MPAEIHLTKGLRDVMSTTTATFGNGLTANEESTHGSAEHHNFYKRFIEARTRQARAPGAFSPVSDTEVVELGFSRDDRIREIRVTQPGDGQHLTHDTPKPTAADA
jgi:hypothetical protein